MYYIRYIDDISSLIALARWVQELLDSEICPFPIENVLGGAKVAPPPPPPNTFSMGIGRTSLVHNSGRQRANALKLELSSKYLVQYILGEYQGNPAMLIN